LKYQDAFSKDSKDIGTTNLVEHTIETGDARPIRIPPRRIPLAKIKQAEDEIKEMADGGITLTANFSVSIFICVSIVSTFSIFAIMVFFLTLQGRSVVFINLRGIHSFSGFTKP
jgi:uncharacterized membrane protein